MQLTHYLLIRGEIYPAVTSLSYHFSSHHFLLDHTVTVWIWFSLQMQISQL